MNLNFECHVTVDIVPAPGQEHINRTILEKIAKQLHWTTSIIDGDPVLGDRKHFYFTRHADDYITIYDRMRELLSLLGMQKIPARRKKIELVLYDQRNTDPELI